MVLRLGLLFAQASKISSSSDARRQRSLADSYARFLPVAFIRSVARDEPRGLAQRPGLIMAWWEPLGRIPRLRALMRGHRHSREATSDGSLPCYRLADQIASGRGARSDRGGA
jgi:hypothetical protein